MGGETSDFDKIISSIRDASGMLAKPRPIHTYVAKTTVRQKLQPLMVAASRENEALRAFCPEVAQAIADLLASGIIEDADSK